MSCLLQCGARVAKRYRRSWLAHRGLPVVLYSPAATYFPYFPTSKQQIFSSYQKIIQPLTHPLSRKILPISSPPTRSYAPPTTQQARVSHEAGPKRQPATKRLSRWSCIRQVRQVRQAANCSLVFSLLWHLFFPSPKHFFTSLAGKPVLAV